jgi:hypothetical protein
MHYFNNSYGAFSEPFDVGEEKGLISIHPELQPAPLGVMPNGRYSIYGVHPKEGSFALVIDQHESGTWICSSRPSFVSSDFIQWIGATIENYYQ